MTAACCGYAAVRIARVARWKSANSNPGATLQPTRAYPASSSTGVLVAHNTSDLKFAQFRQLGHLGRPKAILLYANREEAGEQNAAASLIRIDVRRIIWGSLVPRRTLSA
jgi:hypothetical protein